MPSAILLIGGKGKRFGSDKGKTILAGKPLFLHSLETFHQHPEITEIIIVARFEEIDEYTKLKTKFPKIKYIVEGGTERQYSVKNGIQKSTKEITLIHNSANPLVTAQEITETIKATKIHGAAVVGQKAVNTLKKVTEDGLIIQTIPRENIYEVQTPQGVNTKTFQKLIHIIQDASPRHPEQSEGTIIRTPIFTDDVSFFEHENLPVKIVPVSKQNFKITYPEDITKAESILNPKIKTGIGHDSHKFINCHPEPVEGLHSTSTKSTGQTITLGGIQIPHTKTFDANSDGDVVIHSICNAIGTAIGQGSLSKYADKLCLEKNITDSKEYLKHIFLEAKKLNYEIGNIACSIEALEPKLEKHIPAMKEFLSKLLDCTTLQIGIACTSGEELSDFGKGLGIQCFANIILTKNKYFLNPPIQCMDESRIRPYETHKIHTK